MVPMKTYEYLKKIWKVTAYFLSALFVFIYFMMETVCNQARQV